MEVSNNKNKSQNLIIELQLQQNFMNLCIDLKVITQHSYES